MLITREMDYATRAVRALCDGKIKPSTELAEEEFIPSAFAYKVLKKLAKSGILEIVRGPSGGYKLLKKPSELTLFDVLCAVEDQLVITECLEENHQCPRNQETPCGIHREFVRIQNIMEKELKEKNFEMLLKL